MNTEDLVLYESNFFNDQSQATLTALAIIVGVTIISLVASILIHKLALSYKGLRDLGDVVFRWFLHVSSIMFLVIAGYAAYSTYNMEYTDILAETAKIAQEEVDFSAKEYEITIYKEKDGEKPVAFEYLGEYYAVGKDSVVQLTNNNDNQNVSGSDMESNVLE